MIAVTYPDVERAMVDIIATALTAQGETVTVGVGVPTNWKPTDSPHVSVAVDSAVAEHPVIVRCSTRITVRAASTTEAKRLANLTLGLACAHDGHGPISLIRPLAAVIAARDPDTQAELASCTVRAVARSTTIEAP